MHEDNSAGLGELLNLWQIRRLKHRYVNMLDDRASPEELASLFTEDGIWSGPDGYGHHEGREQLIPFFKRLSSNALFTIHMVGNEVIDVTGDAAHGRSLQQHRGNRDVFGRDCIAAAVKSGH